MRQTRAKAKKSDSVNTQNNVPVTATSPAKISPLTTLLSQYELLRTLCGHLSSADIIHLAQTSKEHWQYIASSPKLREDLIANSSCDGLGIVAQARVFGHWKGNPNNATRKCRGKDAKQCVDCGAMVCNACRFHIHYPKPTYRMDNVSHSTVKAERSDSGWDFDELFLSIVIDDEGWDDEIYRNVETRKAWDILVLSREESYCEDCQPLIARNEWCKCCFYENFVKLWRCIPCVLAEQAKAVTSQQPNIHTFIADDKGRGYYGIEPICRCGKPEANWGILNCRLCGKGNGVKGSFESYKEKVLDRIYSQFGTSRDGPSDDPILSQLG